MTDFNLRQLVRNVLATSNSKDPFEVAAEALPLIDPAEYEAVVGQLLPIFVREVIRDARNHGTPMPVFPQSSQGSSAPVAVPRPLKAVTAQNAPVVLQETVSGAPASQPVARSSKVAAYQAMGLKWLESSLYTSQDPRGWKAIGDCTFDDLMFAVRNRRDQARRTLARAEQYETLAGLLRVHGVDRVRDLPADVLRGINGGAAA